MTCLYQRVCLLLLLGGVGMPTIALAQGYIPLVGIPGLEGDQMTTENYINAMLWLSISLGALLAVGQLIWAGVIYMLSELTTSKEEAKRKIQGALLGLGIVLSAVLLLQTINPQLTNLTALNNLPPLTADFRAPRVETVPKARPDTLQKDYGESYTAETIDAAVPEGAEILAFMTVKQDYRTVPAALEFRKMCSEKSKSGYRFKLTGRNASDEEALICFKTGD